MSELRAFWLRGLKEPSPSETASQLAERFHADQQHAQHTLVSVGAPEAARADAVARLIRGTLVRALCKNPEPFEGGPYWSEICASLSSDDQEIQETACEDATARPATVQPPDPIDPNDEYLPWTLTDRARNAAASQRATLVDAAIDAYAAIVDTPRDPGNDNGPFTALAPIMDEDQVRRSLEIARRMEAARWPYMELTPAYLIGRLAALGRPVEAESLLPTISSRDARYFCLGQVFACSRQQAIELCAEYTDSLHRSIGDELVEWARGVAYAYRDGAPQLSVVRKCTAIISQHPSETARGGALVLMAGWFGVGPTDEWLALLLSACGDDDRTHCLFALCEEATDDTALPRLVRAALDSVASLATPRLLTWLSDNAAALDHLPVEEACEVFATALVGAPEDGSWPLEALANWEQLGELVERLGGAKAAPACARMLREVEDLLGP